MNNFKTERRKKRKKTNVEMEKIEINIGCYKYDS